MQCKYKDYCKSKIVQDIERKNVSVSSIGQWLFEGRLDFYYYCNVLLILQVRDNFLFFAGKTHNGAF